MSNLMSKIKQITPHKKKKLISKKKNGCNSGLDAVVVQANSPFYGISGDGELKMGS